MTDFIFVFGSNTGGIHGAGAAAYARDKCGAKMGVGVGRTGQSYAIPTKAHRMGRGDSIWVGDTLPLEAIKIYVQNFIHYAEDHPELRFQVTRVGCGLAGLKDQDIAPMFREASNKLSNLWFDNKWANHLCVNAKFWGTF